MIVYILVAYRDIIYVVVMFVPTKEILVVCHKSCLHSQRPILPCILGNDECSLECYIIYYTSRRDCVYQVLFIFLQRGYDTHVTVGVCPYYTSGERIELPQ